MFKPQNSRTNTRTNYPERDTTDVQRVVDHLNHAFGMATKDLGRAGKAVVDNVSVPNQLYKLQVEFSYMIDAITRGPRYIAPKVIADCNEFIANITKQ